MVQYTQAQKLAYYKRLAGAKSGRKRATTRSRKAYVPRRTGLKGYGDYSQSKYYSGPMRPGEYRNKGPKRVYNPDKSVGQQMGSAIGGGLGLAGEQFLRWLTGSGDYTIKHNSLLRKDPPPMYNRSNKGGTLIRNREYLTDIISSSTAGQFNLQSFPLQPGQEQMFPWLSQVAVNYEQYSFEGVVLEFRSMSGDALTSVNTALGSVVMATNYDSLDANFLSKAEMENYEFGASCKPACDMMHPIECAPRQTTLTELYIRPNFLPTGADIRLYDWGKFQIATVGCQGTSVNLGELWITYQIRLLKPKIYAALGNAQSGLAFNNTNFSNAAPFGTISSIQYIYQSVGWAIFSGGSSINFPVSPFIQVYIVYIAWSGTAVAWTPPTISVINGTVTTNGLGQSLTTPSTGTTASSVSQELAVTINPNTTGSMGLSAAVLPTSGTNVFVRIFQVPNLSGGT